MKRFLLPIVAVILLAACGGGKTEKLQQERDSLLELNQQITEEMNSYTGVLAQVSAGLDTIAQQQGVLISNRDRDGMLLSKEQVLSNLQYFGETLIRQRERISQLEDSLRYTSGDNNKLQSIIKFMKTQLKQKEQEIAMLQEMVKQKDFDIARLEANVLDLMRENQQKDEELKSQADAMNEAWVLICDEDRLDDLSLIWRGKLKMQNMRKSYCRKIDIRETTQFTFKAPEKPVVLTGQPRGSYSIKEGRNDYWTLYILNKDLFWSNTHYLIIMTDD